MYGIELRNVMEIVGIQPITAMPEMPDYIKGIINLRSIIIPILDVRLRFKKQERDYNDRTCIIVIEHGELSIELIVDSVSEVIAISEEDIAKKPDIHKKAAACISTALGRLGRVLCCW